MDRRTFILAGLLLPVSSNSFASIGISASPALRSAFNNVYGITEGRGPTLHILFTPWCYISPEFYGISRPYLDRMSLNWIPYSGGQPEGRISLEQLLRRPGASSIPAVFSKIKHGSVSSPTPLADQQDQSVDQVIRPVLLRDTGLGIVSPTMLYSIGDRVRVIRGGIRSPELDILAKTMR